MSETYREENEINEAEHYCKVGNSRNCDEQCQKIVWMDVIEEVDEEEEDDEEPHEIYNDEGGYNL